MQQTPKENKATPRPSWRRIAFFAILAGAAILYFIFDPMQYRWMPKCLFHQFTGWECPGCGAQRMLHSLLHLDFREAFNANPFLLLSLPLLIFLVWLELRRRQHPRLYASVYSQTMIIATAAAIVVWTILRNLL